MKNVTRIGIDLAKNSFQIHGVDEEEKKVLQRKLKRKNLLAFFANLKPCLIGMEACSGAHYWASKLKQQGHSVKLMAPQHVKPYVKGNKNDANDAEAICEAVARPNMRYVPIKTPEQLSLQALHRIRNKLVQERTLKGNQIRGLLAEFGLVVAQRIEKLRSALPGLLEDAENELPFTMREELGLLYEDLRYLDQRVAQQDRKIKQEAHSNEAARRLLTLRGVGPVIATAIVAAIGDGHEFTSGRAVSSWAGLVPGQHSTGGKERLLGISKRGDAYLRTLLIHGARAVIRHAPNRDDRLSQWVQALCQRRNKNVAAVALANKTLRMAWALLTRGGEYQEDYLSEAV